MSARPVATRKRRSDRTRAPPRSSKRLQGGSIPTRAARSTTATPIELLVRHHPLRAVHRRAGEHGHAGVLRALPDSPRRWPRRRPGRRRGDHPVHRLLPQQDEEPDRHGAGAGGGVIGGEVPRDDGGASRAAGRRAQDRQRRSSETPSGSTKGSRWTPTSPGSRDCSALTRQDDPVKIEQDLMPLFPQRRLGAALPPPDLPRTPGLHRPPAALPRLRAGRPLPLRRDLTRPASLLLTGFGLVAALAIAGSLSPLVGTQSPWEMSRATSVRRTGTFRTRCWTRAPASP